MNGCAVLTITQTRQDIQINYNSRARKMNKICPVPYHLLQQTNADKGTHWIKAILWREGKAYWKWENRRRKGSMSQSNGSAFPAAASLHRHRVYLLRKDFTKNVRLDPSSCLDTKHQQRGTDRGWGKVSQFRYNYLDSLLCVFMWIYDAAHRHLCSWCLHPPHPLLPLSP